MRHLYWYLSTFIKKHGWILLISTIVAVLFFSIALPLFIANFSFKPKHYIGLIGEYNLDNLPDQINEQLSYGLMGLQADNEVVPALAEKYSIGDDHRSYTFTLKKGLLWQDGIEITADQIKYNLPGVNTAYEGDHLAYTLSEPFAPFLNRLTKPLIRFEVKKDFLGNEKFQVIGIGDYRLKDYSYKDQSTHKLKEIVIDEPEREVVYRFYLTEEQSVLALKRGEIDEINGLSSPRDLISWQNMSITEKNNQNQYLGLFFNLSDSRFSKNIRQAFAYALEKADGDRQVTSPISHKSWAYFKGVKKYDRNLDKAIERLLSELPGETLEIKLLTNSQNYSKAQEIKKDLENLGEQAYAVCQADEKKYAAAQCPFLLLKIDLQVNNFPNLDDYELLLIGQKIPLDPDQYSFWHSGQPGNFTNYKNTRVDALLENGRQALDKKERTSIYQEFQQVFLEDAPVIFLEYLVEYNIARIKI